MFHCDLVLLSCDLCLLLWVAWCSCFCFADDFSFSCAICNLKSFLWGGVGIACLCTKLTLSWDMCSCDLCLTLSSWDSDARKWKTMGCVITYPVYRNEMMSTSVWIFMCSLCARQQTKRSVFYEDFVRVCKLTNQALSVLWGHCGSVQGNKASIQTVFYEEIVGK